MKRAMIRMESGALLTWLVEDDAVPGMAVLTPPPPWGERPQRGTIEAVEPFGPEVEPYDGPCKEAWLVR